MNSPRFLTALAVILFVVGAARGQTSGPGGYRLEKDLPYREGLDLSDYARERCRADVYFPEAGTNLATVVWFHGGGLTEGNRFIPAGLKNQGIIVVAANYRLHPKVKAPAYIEDAAAAVAWAFRQVPKYGGSTHRIFVSGHSAGGYLAAMVGLDRRWLAVHGMDANQIAGLIPLSPQAITHFTVRKERGIGDKQPVIDEFAPLYHVRGDAPPILLVTGDREKELLGRYEENAYLWRMFQVLGHPDAGLVELKGFDHGSMAEPGLPLLLEFVRRHSKP